MMESEFDFEDESGDGEGRLRRVYLLLVSFFILVILLVYVFSSSVGEEILAGWISSSSLDENALDFSFDGKLTFNDGSLLKLKNIYKENYGREFKACLIGYRLNKSYFIQDVYIPITYSQKFNQVIAEPCSDDSLVSLHSHPFRRCLPSEQDFRNFREFKSRQENGLMIVMCEEERFGVYE